MKQYLSSPIPILSIVWTIDPVLGFIFPLVAMKTRLSGALLVVPRPQERCITTSQSRDTLSRACIRPTVSQCKAHNLKQS